MKALLDFLQSAGVADWAASAIAWTLLLAAFGVLLGAGLAIDEAVRSWRNRRRWTAISMHRSVRQAQKAAREKMLADLRSDRESKVRDLPPFLRRQEG